MNFRCAFRRGLVGALLAITVFAAPARAQIGSDRYASIVVDAQSGQIISSANPDEYRFPASLTKMMTMYMVFEAIRDRRIALGDLVPVSPWAASMPPTKLGLTPRTTLTVEQALLGLVTRSANDAAAALGEMIGGDEDRFAQLMTLRAHALGMSRTTFRNASGLPDWGQVTTARDLAILARHLVQDFPQFYHYFSTPSFVFHGRVIPNHQTMLRSYAGADGMKTGYTEASGYNVVTSAMRGDVRLIGVTLGASNGWERDNHMAALLDQGFIRLGVANAPVMARREPDRIPALISAAEAAPVVARFAAPAPEPQRWAARRGAPPRYTRIIAPPAPYYARPWTAPPPPSRTAFRSVPPAPRAAREPVAARQPARVRTPAAAPSRPRAEPRRASHQSGAGRTPG